MKRRGLLIAFEGIDGSGKSTQVPLLATWLQQRNYPVLATREPTDGPYGQQIRCLYDNRQQISRDEELALFLLDRKQHVQECINPALEAGTIVLTDRYYFSTAAYQGAAGCAPENIFARHDFAPAPDLVLLFTMPVTAALTRIRYSRGEQPNAFEQREQLEQVADLFSSFTHACIVRIKADAPISTVQVAVQNAVEPLIAPKGAV